MRCMKSTSRIARTRSGTNCGGKLKRPSGAKGGMSPPFVVVTVTVAVPLPEANVFGLTLHVVKDAGGPQVKLTWALNPASAETVIALVKVAVWPALTVSVVVPVGVREKSGGAVTVKLDGADVPPGAGSTTYMGNVPGERLKGKNTEDVICVELMKFAP